MTKHAGGRPSEYAKINLDQVKTLARKGFTDAELAGFFDVAISTIYFWKNEHPEFLEALKLGKEEADNKVERSLFESATGYSHPDTHVAVSEGQVILTPITKIYKPDTTAGIFWLKNRRPDKWRDKMEVQDDRLTALLNHINRKEQDGKAKQDGTAGRAGAGDDRASERNPAVPGKPKPRGRAK